MARIVNTPPRIMVGATSSTDGIAGLVPTPPAGNELIEFLRKDGSYAVPAGTGGGGSGGLIVESEDTDSITLSSTGTVTEDSDSVTFTP